MKAKAVAWAANIPRKPPELWGALGLPMARKQHLGRARRHRVADPELHHHFRQVQFDCARHIGQHGKALFRTDTQRADAPGLDLRADHAGRCDQVEINFTGDHRGQRLRRTFVGDLRELDAGHRAQQLSAQRAHAAGADRAVIQFAGAGFRQINQILHRTRRRCAADDQHR